ncbi:hypothetical protein PINS_up019188 [Pythium insidiosum]|nr:hypothetical protein PINS_up019188 [Pythium insidiosum]
MECLLWQEALLERQPTARHSQRTFVPEPAGRELLLGKLKLLALDLRDRQRPSLPSSKDEALLQYVLSASTADNEVDDEHDKAPVPRTPRMAELGVQPSREEVVLRPGTSCGRRPSTAQRPVSRGSTVSLSSTSSSLLESPEVRAFVIDLGKRRRTHSRFSFDSVLT